jgi:hypothetical protein
VATNTPANAPPVPPRLSQAIAEVHEGRDSWPSRAREEITAYVAQLRDSGMTPERSLVTIKQVAQPLFLHSEKMRKQVMNWVLDAYYDRRSDRG